MWEDTLNNRTYINTHRPSLTTSVCALMFSLVLSVIPVVSQMLSAYLQQMVAGSNSLALCEVHLSVHLCHAQVHPTRHTSNCEDHFLHKKSLVQVQVTKL